MLLYQLTVSICTDEDGEEIVSLESTGEPTLTVALGMLDMARAEIYRSVTFNED